jgi:tetratricopeptide (TPR) repeat protein
LAAVLLAGAAGGVWYLNYQWQAAQSALEADRPEEALNRLSLCLWAWPSRPEVHLLVARAARITGDLNRAEAHLNRCLKLNRGATGEVQLEFLFLRVQTGELDQVAPLLIDSVEKDHPQSPLILETLARAYLHHLRYRPAHACLSRWIELRPDAAKAYFWRGWVQERLNHSKQAMADYQQALDLNPELVTVRLRVAEMLLEDNKPLEALEHLERLHRQFPSRPDITARLGQCRFLQGQFPQARRLLEAAVQDLPKDPPLLLHLGKLELQEGRPVEAERWLRRVLEVDPTDTEAHYSLSGALRSQRRDREAAAALKEYEKNKALLDRTNRLLRDEADQPSNDPGTLAEIGSLLLRVGRERLGVYWLHQALERDPAHQPAHRALAEHFEKKGEWDKAAAHRRRLTAQERRPAQKVARP